MDGNARGLELFLASIMTVADPIVKEDLGNPENQGKIGKALGNLLFDRGGQTHVANLKPLSAKERVVVNLVQCFREVHTTYNRLRHPEVFVRQYPSYKSFKTRGITRAEYLAYHIEKFLEEQYILAERLRRFQAEVSKLALKDRHAISALRKAGQLRNLLSEHCAGSRRTHVHHQRYTDPDLDRLAALELFSTSPRLDTTLMTYTRRLVYPKIRSRWAKRMKRENDAVKQLLDAYFNIMHALVFKENGGLRPEIC